MPRSMLSDAHWSKLRRIMNQIGIYNKRSLRKTVEGMLYRIRVGCPWRDIPQEFGCWNSIFQTFNRWSSKGKIMLIFKTLVHDPDLEWEFIDGSIVKAHQHSAGAASEENQAIGKSCAGNTTKIHMAVDAHGLPIGFEITGGEVHDCKIAPEFIEKLPNAAFTIADKGYDSEYVREVIRKKSSIPVIPRKSNSKTGNDDMDWYLYKHRHLVENVFARVKQFRGLATRFDKLKRNYASVVAIVCALLWLPM